EVFVRCLPTLNERARVLGLSMPGSDFAEVICLLGSADGNVSDRMILKLLGVSLPDFDALDHHGRHRWLKVVIANNTASDAARPSGDTCFVDYHNLVAGRLSGLTQRLRQMVSSA